MKRLILILLLLPLLSNAQLGQYLGAGSATTKLLLHLNGNSTDASGNANNGTDTNITYSLGNGKFGQGMNGGRIKIINPIGLNIKTNITISIWVKLNGQSSATYVLAYRKNFAPWAGDNYSIIYGYITAKFELYSDLYTGTSPRTALTTSLAGSTSWNNIIFTYNGTTVNGYINGKLDVSTNKTFQFKSTDASNIYINGIVDDIPSPFNTIIYDEIIIESRAWTSSEVKKYFTYSKARFGID